MTRNDGGDGRGRRDDGRRDGADSGGGRGGRSGGRRAGKSGEKSGGKSGGRSGDAGASGPSRGGHGRRRAPEGAPEHATGGREKDSGRPERKPAAGGRPARPRRREPAPPPQAALPDELRLQAYLARAGVASRRASEELIREGRVTIDGERAEIGAKVQIPRDQVRVDGALVQLQRIEWVALHKPTGYVTTRDDPSGRRTVYDLIPAELHHLFHVGRLDRDSSGLLLLTNDGEAANRLLHPRYETSKEYWADVEGEPDHDALKRLVSGVKLEDGVAQAVYVRPLGETDSGHHRLEIVLKEGRNREVRRMLEAVGHPVHRLLRRRFGPIELGKLRTGHWRRLTAQEIQGLR